MFAPYCPRHDARVLLGYESVVAVEQTPNGPKVLLHCHCGELVAHDAEPPARAALQTGVFQQAQPHDIDAHACLSAC